MSLFIKRWSLRPCGNESIQSIIEEGKQAASLGLWLSKYPRLWDTWLLHLNKVEWAVWGCLTWRVDEMREDTEWAQRKREHNFQRLLAIAAPLLGVRRRWLRFYHTTERTGGGGCHLHFALSQEGLDFVSYEDVARTLSQIWEREFGNAEVECFNPSLHFEGVAYMTKIEYAPNGEPYDAYRRVSDRLHQSILRESESLVQCQSRSVSQSQG